MRPAAARAASLAARLLAAAAPAVTLAAPAAGVARQDEILMLGNLAGAQSARTGSDGVTHAEYSFNDRGRGDHIVATWKLDAAGAPTEYQGRGNDYMKAPVTETFRLAAGKAIWSNRSERGSAAVSGEAFYVPVNGPPEILGVLARALLKAPGHRLALLPAGEATLEKVDLPAEDAAHATGPHGALALYAISGLVIPKGEEAAYREALPAMLDLLKALHEAGVTIIPGTDSMPGYELHHELELYARAGIAPAEVLRMATLTSAQVIGANGERGVIAAGKLADLILVDGDPSARIGDLDHIDLVMKGGRTYDPARIEASLGITPVSKP